MPFFERQNVVGRRSVHGRELGFLHTAASLVTQHGELFTRSADGLAKHQGESAPSHIVQVFGLDGPERNADARLRGPSDWRHL